MVFRNCFSVKIQFACLRVQFFLWSQEGFLTHLYRDFRKLHHSVKSCVGAIDSLRISNGFPHVQFARRSQISSDRILGIPGWISLGLLRLPALEFQGGQWGALRIGLSIARAYAQGVSGHAFWCRCRVSLWISLVQVLVSHWELLRPRRVVKFIGFETFCYLGV